jgi:hypothetical protein
MSYNAVDVDEINVSKTSHSFSTEISSFSKFFDLLKVLKKLLKT